MNKIEKALEQERFEAICKPIIEFLNEFHPHVSIIITPTSAELSEGMMAFYTEEYIKD